MVRSSLMAFSWISACSKKDRTFAIKTLFYILSTVPFRVDSLLAIHRSQSFFLKRTFCDAQFSYGIFLNLRVFKKRPNFLNSSPTSIESALGLLSAPSGRFWQQTAISPVSLWVLVVELLPLNWARAQAVRRINQMNSGCSSTTNDHSGTGQMAVCCQNLPLDGLCSRSAPSMLFGELFKKFSLFLNTRRFRKMR
jgi:hypothetical protein